MIANAAAAISISINGMDALRLTNYELQRKLFESSVGKDADQPRGSNQIDVIPEDVKVKLHEQ